MSISAPATLDLLLRDPEAKWEVEGGQPREKPAMAFEHSEAASELGHRLRAQLDRRVYRVHVDGGRVLVDGEDVYIPDVVVIPLAVAERFRHRFDVVALYDTPLPLVIEVWSPSTGGYDVTRKLPRYRQRGDLEIWLVHPYDRTVTIWRRQTDGSYQESVVRDGIVRPQFAPEVEIDLWRPLRLIHRDALDRPGRRPRGAAR
jgi:Uma2 family endonuclease